MSRTTTLGEWDALRRDDLDEAFKVVFQHLRREARRRLHGRAFAAFDEDDVAQEVAYVFLRRAEVRDPNALLQASIRSAVFGSFMNLRRRELRRGTNNERTGEDACRDDGAWARATFHLIDCAHALHAWTFVERATECASFVAIANRTHVSERSVRRLFAKLVERLA